MKKEINMENLLYIIIEGGLKSLIVIIGLLIGVAFATLLERKVMAAMQKRRGPNVVGFVGLLQPLADGLKLVLKETIIPIVADKIIYAIAPILTFTISIVLWSVIAVGVQSVFASINSGVIFILAISSIGVYGIILAGWASNSKYAFLGGLRSAAQMVSYEVALGLIILSIITYAGTVNIQEIMENQEKVWFIVPLLPGFLLAFISALAETNRPPFDLPEAEAELVSGYNVEYSSTGFALFFLGEYANIILMSVLLSVFFLGGIVSNKISGAMKGVGMLCSFIWVRATLPRYRYDQLMYLGWKSLLPFALLIYIGVISMVLIIK
uniref:NADH-ubiquinone oxidoreductase chain 1 n=1 Tax=Dictyostelium citrinum TaxID=361072 RepID=NU1M_DICCI|nr:NADH dehydrogenase subunit 1 [Dictyostelium citrinum]Q2LCR1.1 RecName: Full=NADH-ubiquinone oxidoreductase chain 1; AltName: Full=NADH dehydrogenase subunit 1 [Dictyostelium citrinum]ABC60382.1 NADH dehydrogenase subunit 1 [Dictyostelium citrinum]